MNSHEKAESPLQARSDTPPSSVLIRRLLPADVSAYRRLRLIGLRESPTAFGSSYSDEAKQPFTFFLARLEPSPAKWVFGAFAGNRLVGVATLIRDHRPKERHKASIAGVYVSRRMRRKGIGRALMGQILMAAGGLAGLRQVRLSVVASNRGAVRLYLEWGFRIYGREEAALQVGKRFYDELFLARRVPGLADRSDLASHGARFLAAAKVQSLSRRAI